MLQNKKINAVETLNMEINHQSIESQSEKVDGMTVISSPIDKNYEPKSKAHEFKPDDIEQIRKFQEIFIHLCTLGEIIRQHVTEARALEAIYTADQRIAEQNKLLLTKMNQVPSPALDFIQKGAADLQFAEWLFNIESSIATRNRLRTIIKYIEQELNNIISQQDEIRILSLGAGSGRSFFEVLRQNKFKDKNIKAIMVDKDPWAVEYMQKFARQIGVENLIETHQQDAIRYLFSLARKQERIKRVPENEKQKQVEPFPIEPPITEMTGLIDYFSSQNAVKILSKIFEIMPKGGFFITSNISSTINKKFLEEVMGWKGMYYRTKDEFQDIIDKAIQQSGAHIEYNIETENTDSPEQDRTTIYLIATCRKI